MDQSVEVPAFKPVDTSKVNLRYVLMIMFLTNMFIFIDRGILRVVQEPIKAEFGLTDFQLGLLGGPAFGLFYGLFALPIARLADRRNRIKVLAGCIAILSAATSFCGFATGFWMLFLGRVGVATGEGGGLPTSHSSLSDYFDKDRRTMAISIFTLGGSFGTMMASIGGGYIAQNWNWREAFWFLGAPGLILALVTLFTVREPMRRDTRPPLDMREAFKSLSNEPLFWYICFASVGVTFTGFGVGQFTNSFFVRTHGLSIFDSGLVTGVVAGVGACIGVLISGYLPDKLGKGNLKVVSWFPIIGLSLAVPLFLGCYASASLPIAITFFSLATITKNFAAGPMGSLMQNVVDPRARATAAAIMLMMSNILGYALGPPILGLISDAINNDILTSHGLTADLCKGASGTIAATCAAASARGLQLSLLFGYAGYTVAVFFFLAVARQLYRKNINYAEV